MLRFNLLPANELNLNDLRVALLNYIVANQDRDNFLIFINDITQEYIEGKEQESLDILKKFAINTEQKIYKKDNLSIYQRFATKLIEEKKAFLCFCDSKDCRNRCSSLLKSEIKERLSSKESYKIILQGSNKIKSFTIIKANQIPTLDFTIAIDDMISGVSKVIAINSEQNSIKIQQYIQQLLNYNQNIQYYFIPKILDSVTIKELLKDGFLPDAIINYLLRLNSSLRDKIFYLPDAIKWLDISNFSSNSIEFNLKELKELNREHLLQMDSKKLSSIVGFADSDIGELLKYFLTDISTINELEEKFKAIFKVKKCNNEAVEVANIIKKAPMIESFDKFKEYIMKKSKLKEQEILNSLKILIGVEKDKQLGEIYPFIKSYILEVARCQ